jgi:pyruvate dehydrogenase E1 component alpha subunit
MPSLKSLYQEMVRVRHLNDEAIAMHLRGVIHGFAPCTGQEAAQIGSAAALDPARDFAFPTYREFGAMVAMGIAPAAVVAHFAGIADGGMFDALEAHVAPLNSVVGGTALHAVGWAMGSKLDGDGSCALAYFGDGGSSQGEVHEALNFAGVFTLPVVFFCQNNRWAISVPVEQQVAGGSIAARATGYGIPAVEVDGNDVVAVYEATRSAVERARAGGGATLIEALTYRLGPHATSDDPSRYRTAEEEQRWRQRDPIAAARNALSELGEADDAFVAHVDAQAEAEVERLRAELAALQPLSLEEQLMLVYERTPEAAKADVAEWLTAGGLHV